MTKEELGRLKAVYLSPSTLRWTTLEQDMRALVDTIEAAWQERDTLRTQLAEMQAKFKDALTCRRSVSIRSENEDAIIVSLPPFRVVG